MYSEYDNSCSHELDFSIRKSPDHSLLATPRGLSQLVTSFIAFLRLGIHTRALSSLTIKFTQHTYTLLRPATHTYTRAEYTSLWAASINLCFIMPVSIQLSKILVLRFEKLRSNLRLATTIASFLFEIFLPNVGLLRVNVGGPG